MHKITKQSQITLIELPPTLFGKLNGDMNFDIYSYSKMPSRALHVLEGILRYNGFTNTKSINPNFNKKRGILTSEDFKRILNSDILLISSITRTSPQSQELARLYKQKNPKGIVIAGGPDPTFRVEDWLNYVDIIVIGEGEKTLLELMNQLIENPENLNSVKGIAFKKNRKTVITKPRELLTNEELSQLPHPFYDKDIRKKITSGVVETSRGCPNNCDFCTVTKIYGRQYRVKSIDYVIEELKRTKNIGSFLFFSDDNLTAIPNKTMELLKAIIKNNLNKKYSVAQTTIKLADNPELMSAIKKANINALCIGIESINNETLKELGKPYTAEQNKRAIKILRKAGFWIHGMMMLGGEGDTPKSLKNTLEWANQNLDSVQFFSLIPVPGTPFYDKMKKQGRILTKKYYLYDGQHVVTKPKNFTPYKLQKTIFNMYGNFYSLRKTLKRLKHSPSKTISLGFLIYSHFSGRKMFFNPQTKAHLEFLKSVS